MRAFFVGVLLAAVAAATAGLVLNTLADMTAKEFFSTEWARP